MLILSTDKTSLYYSMKRTDTSPPEGLIWVTTLQTFSEGNCYHLKELQTPMLILQLSDSDIFFASLKTDNNSHVFSSIHIYTQTLNWADSIITNLETSTRAAWVLLNDLIYCFHGRSLQIRITKYYSGNGTYGPDRISIPFSDAEVTKIHVDSSILYAVMWNTTVSQIVKYDTSTNQIETYITNNDIFLKSITMFTDISMLLLVGYSSSYLPDQPFYLGFTKYIYTHPDFTMETVTVTEITNNFNSTTVDFETDTTITFNGITDSSVDVNVDNSKSYFIRTNTTAISFMLDAQEYII